MKKILVAMSGGVDSAVTAYVLKNQGYDCGGCTMILHNNSTINNDESEDLPKDVKDAQAVASKMEMDFQVVDYREEFEQTVIKDFVNCYQCGMTPNPCIVCNKYMKFGRLINEAIRLGYDGIATGHYARIEFDGNEFRLRKAADINKDQSYVLYSLTQEQLSHVLFPLGGMTKPEVRSIAEERGFINARKHDSQDICFVPDGDYASMIEEYTNIQFKEGPFMDMNGNILGMHKGVIHYTIGQRRGLGIPAADRLYVVRLDVENNIVYLGSNDDLFSDTVRVRDFHWISNNDIPVSFECKAKIRYKHIEQPATVHYEGNGCATIVFKEKQRAITPGQTAVLYDGEYVLGGGLIV